MRGIQNFVFGNSNAPATLGDSHLLFETLHSHSLTQSNVALLIRVTCLDSRTGEAFKTLFSSNTSADSGDFHLLFQTLHPQTPVLSFV